MAKENDNITKEIARIKSLIKRGEMHLNEYDAINHEKDILEEMAFQRKDFIIQSIFMLPQIIQNWCLCYYTSKNGLDKGLREHWGGELESHLLNVASNKIKGNNSYESRIKAFTEVWDRKETNKDPNVINMIINTKFSKENIPTNTEAYQDTLHACVSAAKDLINILSEANIENIKNYVLSI